MMQQFNVIDSDKYTMGQFVKTFENNFGKFIKRKYCVMVSSGSANLLSIASYSIQRNQN